MAEAFGLAVGEQAGFVASLRRHLAAGLQSPGEKDTSEYYMTPYLENVPLRALEALLDHKYWTQSGGSTAGGSSVGQVVFRTDSSKALGMLYQTETCRPLGIDCAKLVLPAKAVVAVQMLIAQPPGVIVHRTREDKSFVIEAHFNFATLNEECLTPPPYPAGRYAVAPPPVSICISQRLFAG
jgi:hypothetical protein